MNVSGRASCGNCDNLIGCAERQARMPFSAYRDNFDAETLAILEAAFNEAWEVVTASGGDFVRQSRKALRLSVNQR